MNTTKENTITRNKARKLIALVNALLLDDENPLLNRSIADIGVLLCRDDEDGYCDVIGVNDEVDLEQAAYIKLEILRYDHCRPEREDADYELFHEILEELDLSWEENISQKSWIDHEVGCGHGWSFNLVD